jgi:hypothetical protein
MGSVVGEKNQNVLGLCFKNKIPFMIISKSEVMHAEAAIVE